MRQTSTPTVLKSSKNRTASDSTITGNLRQRGTEINSYDLYTVFKMQESLHFTRGTCPVRTLDLSEPPKEKPPHRPGSCCHSKRVVKSTLNKPRALSGAGTVHVRWSKEVVKNTPAAGSRGGEPAKGPRAMLGA